MDYLPQLNPRNRLSKFEYFPGDEAATLASEDVLITTMPKSSSIHAGGWCGFKPSDYGNTVRAHSLYTRLLTTTSPRLFIVECSRNPHQHTNP